MIFLIIAAFIGIMLFEAPGLIRKKSWRELTVFSFLLTLALVISILEIMNVKFPNPVRDTQYFVKNLLPFGYD